MKILKFDPDGNYKLKKLGLIATIFILIASFLFGSEARQWQIASASPGDAEAMIAYGELGAITPRYRLWNGTDLGSELSDGTMAVPNWVVLKSAPTRDEKMLVVSDSGRNVYACVWNGTSSSWGTVKSLGIVATSAANRGFDVAYEQSSGDAVIVSSDNSTNTDIQYWVWDGSSWVVDGATYNITITTIKITWISLAPDPASDEIALIYATGSDVGGVIWDGSAWDNQQLLEDTNITAEMVYHEFIAVAYEQASGYAMFTWGADKEPTIDDSGINWRQWNGTGWETEGAAFATGLDTYPPFYLSLKTNPSDDQLMLVVTDNALDLNTVRWSGSVWDSPVEQDAAIETDTNRCADFEWETASGHSGHGVLSWNSDFDQVYARHWDGTNWNTEFETDPYAALTDQEIHQLRRTADGKIFLAMVDDTSDLHVWKWVESTSSPYYGSWASSGNGLGEIETEMSSGTSYEAFMWSSDIPPPEVALSAEKTTTDTGNTVLSPGETYQWMGTFGFVHNKATGDTITQVTITLDGSASSTDIDTIYLYKDDDSTYDGGETLFGSSPCSSVTTPISGSMSVSTTMMRYLHVVFDIASGATIGNTEGAKIAANDDVTFSGDSTLTGAPKTLGNGTILLEWKSYSDLAHSNQCDNFTDPYCTVYMYGPNFAKLTEYKIIYWSSTSQAFAEVVKSGAQYALASEYQFKDSDTPGDWHCTVYLPDTYSPESYSVSDANITADDRSYGGYAFHVAETAIPEFPTMIAAIVVAGLCFGIYYWRRRRHQSRGMMA